MLGFPVPYDDELIYSTVARAGVHFGLTSPKELLDEVFENRKVIATVDLPSHLGAITHLYPECEKFDIYKECSNTYKGPLIIANDLMKIKVKP